MKITKVIEIDCCADCPKLIDLNLAVNFNGSKQKHLCKEGKKEINVKELNIHLEIPNWCPLPDRETHKGED